MKLLKLEIENCLDCPYSSKDYNYYEFLCYNNDAGELHIARGVSFFSESDNKILRSQPIPEWCPLPDKKPNQTPKK